MWGAGTDIAGWKDAEDSGLMWLSSAFSCF